MSVVNIVFNDIVTPEVCSLAIREIIKYVIYNTEQIPYSYKAWTHLVTTIASRKKTDAERRQPLIHNHQAKMFYEKMSTLFFNLEETFRIIEKELSICKGIEEILILLGSTIINPKLVYRICIPEIEFGHSGINHPSRNVLPNLLKGLLGSENAFGQEVGPSNIFVILKMLDGSRCPAGNLFLPRDNFKVSSRAKEVVFRFELTKPQESCECPIMNQQYKFSIYEDSSQNILELDNRLTLTTDEEEEEYCTVWYQMKTSLQGFKSIQLNGTSIYSYLMNDF